MMGFFPITGQIYEPLSDKEFRASQKNLLWMHWDKADKV